MPIKADDTDEVVGYRFECPGCGDYHAPYVHPYKNESGATWKFNEDLDKPTFSPSILVQVKFKDRQTKICHSFITDGRIRFLSDCTHSLASKEVELPDIS